MASPCEYEIDRFFEAVEKSDGVVCYGTGKRFRMYEEYFSAGPAGEKLLYCVDNDKSKQGSPVSFAGRQIEVLPVEALADCRGRNLILLITNYRYDQVQSFLEEMGLLNGVKYYMFSHILGDALDARAMEKEIPQNCRITAEPVISKVIHYCWFGRNPIPDQYKKWMESWRRFCPDYEIIEWNEDNYDVTKNAYMREAYQNKKWGFVSDYARMDIIYEHGGIYLDTDVELIGSLDELLYQPAFMGFESEKSVAAGLGFGAVAGLEDIRELRDLYDTLHFVNGDGSLNLKTIPIYQTEVLKNRGLKLNGEYQRIGNITVYPEKMFAGKSMYSRRIRLKPYSKSIHHYDASWIGETERRFLSELEAEMN